MEALNLRLGFQKGFAALKEEDIPVLASQAAKEGNLFYPAPKVLSEEELGKVFHRLILPKA